MKLSTGFGGGVADLGDLCGAVVGAVMVLGALYGRETSGEDHRECWQLCKDFYAEFAKRCKYTSCSQIRLSMPGGWSHRKCARTVEQATDILLALLDHGAQTGGTT